jgi:predicted Zn finger-like uncharacterized protein
VIVSCSRCGARYRLDESKLTSPTALLRCRKCGERIPVTRPAPQGAAVPVPQGAAVPVPQAAPRPRTALLADEPREFRDLLETELRAAGYEVSVAESGDEALLLAASHRFDLIVLNAYLRRLLGIHVCERLKSDPMRRSVPILLTGALLMREAGEAGPRHLYGADGFIPTSIDRADLTERIRRAAAGEGLPAPAKVPPGPPEPGAAPAAAPAEPPAVGEEAEIRRLARIMISDIQIYHPEKFSRALREGTFFEAFSEELGRGKRIIDARFGHLPNRIQLLAAGLRDTLAAHRGAPRRRASGE